MPGLRVTSTPSVSLLLACLLASSCGGPEASSGSGGATSASGGSGGATTTSNGVGATGGATTTTSGGSGGSGGATTGGTGGATTGGTGGTTSSGTTTTTATTCGNGVLDADMREACDGSDLGGVDCTKLGFPGGTLACTADCKLDVSGCTGAENCNDGLDNDGNGKVDCEDASCAADCADACNAPVALPDPSDFLGSTLQHASVLKPSCGMSSGPEVVHTFTAAMSGVLDITLVEQDMTSYSVSVRTTCGTDASETGCSNSYAFGFPNLKKLIVPISAGESVLIVVDGNGAMSGGAYELLAQSRPVTCGDAFQDAGEGCDDGNTVSGDGCNATCNVEPTEMEPNGTLGNANPFVAPWVAEIAPVGDVDLVKFVLPAPAGIAMAASGLGPNACSDGSMDSLLTILDSNGATLAQNDDYGSSCSFASAANLPAGTYYARIEAAPGATPATATFPYALAISTFHCGDGTLSAGEECDDGNLVPNDGCSSTCKTEVTESEPNGTLALADAYTSPWLARIDPDGDIDVVSVVVPAAGAKITATTADPKGGAGCLGPIDTFVEILDKDGKVLAMNDDAVGYCSSAVASNVAAGTYYVRIQAPPGLGASNVFIYSYALAVKVQ